MTDVVYVLGRGSNWGDNELRFSLRSLEAYVSGLGRVYVVGTRPRWLTGVVHLPFADHFLCKERNIMLKVAHACGHPDLSQTFLHVHDDHFALAYQQAADIPNWCGGSLYEMGKSVDARNSWRDAVLNTHQVLTQRGLPTLNFDIHYPILIDKTAYPRTMDLYDWKGTQRGFVVKSLYANTVGAHGTKMADLKLNNRMAMVEVVDRLKGRPWFSVGNGALCRSFREMLAHLYPKPSRFEI
jgi:hypothetical protein